MPCVRRLLTVLSAAFLAAVPATAAAQGNDTTPPDLSWKDCADPAPAGMECTTASLPRDYAKPNGPKVKIALTRNKATTSDRVGSLFVNYGGPGGEGVSTTQRTIKTLWAPLNKRFDIIGFDPRGVGQSSPSIDCKVNQETGGVYSQPFTTPLNLNVGALTRTDQRYVDRCKRLNPDVLPYVSTANVATDLSLLHRSVGDRKLNYLGFSYGTFLGATYAAMFPNDYRALVLDGALDAQQYISRPQANLEAQSSGFERAIGRFLQACATNQTACSGFGGTDPWGALDALIDRLDASPLNTGGRQVDGDDVRAAVTQAVYSKSLWPRLGKALADGAKGDGAGLRALTDTFYGRNSDGSYSPSLDRYFTIGALEQSYPRKIDSYLDAGERAWGDFDHAYFNNGYTEYAWGLYDVKPRGVFRGPFSTSKRARSPLVVATTYDPATPYRGSVKLTRELGNARLLTMDGDGHTAYGGNSKCIDAAVEAYLGDGTVPPAGTRCKQEVPFQAPTPTTTLQRSAPSGGQDILQPRSKPLVGLSR